jgi:serine protease Do
MVRVVLDAVEHGNKTIARPWIGIEGQDITPELAASLAMAQPSGILVNKVYTASPAAKAGLQVGDVIISVNGHMVEDADAFHYRIHTLPVGTKVDLGIMRRGQKLDIGTELIPPPESPPRDTTEIKGRNPFAGATVENISPAVIDDLGLQGIEHGVAVVMVKDGSTAAALGLQSGDVLLSVNKKKLADVKDVIAAGDDGANYWHISVQRGGNVITVIVGG